MIKKLLAAVSLVGTLGATAPAFADWYGPGYVPAPPVVNPYYADPYYAHRYDRDDDWRWRDRDDWRWRRWHRYHEWREHEWREHHRGWRW